MPESTSLEADSGSYHQIHFAWAEPTLLGRVGPGPAATSLDQQDRSALRSWRDRLIPALTADYRTALPGTNPAAYPETLWAHHYPDGQSALVYRWPGDVREAHAWAIVGPTRGLTLSRILALHENPNTRPASSRPPAPGWAAMRALAAPEPWESTATPGAVRTRDRRAAETRIGDEPILVGALARALEHPDQPIHISLDPDRADLWQAVQLRFLWGVHRTLHDVLTPRAALPADGWRWTFSTYDPVLGVEDGPHLVFGPHTGNRTTGSPFLSRPPIDHLKVADGLVTVLREEGGDALADHLRARGIPETATFAERRELLRDWFDPRPRPPVVAPPEPVVEPERPSEPGSEPGFEIEPGFEERNDLAEAPDPFAEESSPDTSEQEAWADPGEEPRGGRGHTFLGVGRRHPWDRSPEADPFGAHPAGLGNPAGDTETEPPPEEPVTDPDLARPLVPPRLPQPTQPAQSPSPRDTWTISASAPASAPAFPSASTPASSATQARDELVQDPLTRPLEEPTEPTPRADLPQTRAPADAPPLAVLTAAEEEGDQLFDYAAETEPDTEEEESYDPDDNWPTQYVDLPLSRLERWHFKRGPEGARTDVVDARAAVRAERSELQRVRAERDRYHAEVQELRREIARLDQPWIDAEPAADTFERERRWPRVLLVLVLLTAAFVVGLEVGASTGQGALTLLGGLVTPLTSAGWWPW